tara:strand:- start:414 stop:1094 length:681 start_codon:yes stop_codon:yes gene_type:complete
MQNISQLNFSIDSLSKNLVFRYNNFSKNFYARTGISNFLRNVRTDNTYKDSILYKNYNTHLKDYPRSKQLDVLNETLNITNSHIQVLNSQKDNFFVREKIVNLHKSNLYDKYALGFASIILFFVGAPLGAIIRKGGIGLPMVISLLLFLSYHFIGTFSRNAAEDGSIDAFLGSIIPNAIMLPLGLYLIYRASSDKSIFNFDKISYPFRLFLKKISSIKFLLNKKHE